MRSLVRTVTALMSVLVAGLAVAGPAATPSASWADYAVVAKAGKCPGLPAAFSLARLPQPSGSVVFYDTGKARWYWQLNARQQIVSAQFWASDLDAGVRFSDPLEVSRVPSPSRLLALASSTTAVKTLDCGAVVKPVKRWTAPLPVVADNHLLDQSDLADMEGNAMALALSQRLGSAHQH